MDRHCLEADPDPTFHFDANPDPTPSFNVLGNRNIFLFFSHQCQSTLVFLSSQHHSSTELGRNCGFLTQNSFAKFFVWDFCRIFSRLHCVCVCKDILSYNKLAKLGQLLSDESIEHRVRDFAPLCYLPKLAMQTKNSCNSSWDRDTFLRLNSDLWTNFHSHEQVSVSDIIQSRFSLSFCIYLTFIYKSFMSFWDRDCPFLGCWARSLGSHGQRNILRLNSDLWTSIQSHDHFQISDYPELHFTFVLL